MTGSRVPLDPAGLEAAARMDFEASGAEVPWEDISDDCRTAWREEAGPTIATYLAALPVSAPQPEDDGEVARLRAMLGKVPQEQLGRIIAAVDAEAAGVPTNEGADDE